MSTRMSPDAADGWTRMMESMADAGSRIPPLLTYVPHAPARLIKTVLQQQRDQLEFLEQRCQAALALVERLESATTFADGCSAWLEFSGKAVSDYAAAAQKLISRGSQEALEATGAGIGEELQALMTSPAAVA